jgi:hypothetical protein
MILRVSVTEKSVVNVIEAGNEMIMKMLTFGMMCSSCHIFSDVLN